MQAKWTSSDLDQAAGDYRQVFPFTDIDPAGQRSILAAMEHSDILKQRLESLSVDCSYFDTLLFILSMLKSKYIRNPEFYYFMDCLACGGAACNLAVTQGFRRCLSIELSEASKARSAEALRFLQRKYPEASFSAKSCTLKHLVGSMQDYFDFEANIMFMSTLEACANPIVDEARLILTFLGLTRNAEVNSFVIVIAKRLNISLFLAEECRGQGTAQGLPFHHLRMLFSRDQQPDHVCYVLEVVPVKAVAKS